MREQHSLRCSKLEPEGELDGAGAVDPRLNHSRAAILCVQKPDSKICLEKSLIPALYLDSVSVGRTRDCRAWRPAVGF